MKDKTVNRKEDDTGEHVKKKNHQTFTGQLDFRYNFKCFKNVEKTSLKLDTDSRDT